MNTITSRIVTVLLALFLVVYSAYQVYRFIYNPYKTEMAKIYELNTSFSINGVVFREERPIDTATGTAILDYIVPDAAKVGVTTVIAKEYNNEQVVKLAKELALVDEELLALRNTGTGEMVILPSGDALSGQIYEQLGNVVDMSSDGMVEGTSHIKIAIQQIINKRQLAIGRLDDLDNRIEQLTLRKAALEEAIGESQGTITAGASGYFSHFTDGHEEDFTPSFIKDESADELMSMVTKPISVAGNNGIGKIVTDYDWYMVAVITPKEAEHISVGRLLNVTLNEGVGSSRVQMVVENILLTQTEGKLLLVLKSATINAQVLSLRTTSASINTGSIRGIWVNSKAIRFVDGVQGVFVKRPGEVIFKPIQIIYEGQGFVLCNANYTHEEELNLFDEIVIGGKDLYDHKPI